MIVGHREPLKGRMGDAIVGRIKLWRCDGMQKVTGPNVKEVCVPQGKDKKLRDELKRTGAILRPAQIWGKKRGTF